jgi:superfamily II DNA/RNA helicase
VINFDTPNFAEDYVHRIGRTGRADATGDAITFVAHDERDHLRRIERFVGKRYDIQSLPKNMVRTDPTTEPAGMPEQSHGRSDTQRNGRSDSRREQPRQGRGDNRDFKRTDSRDAKRPDSREFNRGDNRDFKRPDSRDAKRPESRDAKRPDSRGTARGFDRPDNREFKRTDNRSDNRSENRGENRGTARGFDRPDNREFKRTDKRTDNRDFNRAETRDERKPVRETRNGPDITNESAPFGGHARYGGGKKRPAPHRKVKGSTVPNKYKGKGGSNGFPPSPGSDAEDRRRDPRFA